MTTEIILSSGEFSRNEVEAFEKQYLSVMKALSNAISEKKKIEAMEKRFKASLEKVMDEYGIKSIDNEFLKITRVSGTEDSTTIDLDKLKGNEPDLYDELLADYPKTVKGKKGSIRFGVK